MPRGVRARGVAVAVIAIIASGASACGDDAERQDADEPAGDFPVEVTSAKFPTDQRLAQTSDLELEIENAGDEDVPDLAVTIFTGDQPSSGSFSVRSDQPGLADPNRPVWILENGFPKLVTPQVKDLDDGSAGGRRGGADEHLLLRRGAAGREQGHRLARDAGPGRHLHRPLRARGRAERQGQGGHQDGGPVEGEFVVTITDKPPQARVNSAGEVEISE